jgi:hypothetical protein
MELGRWRRVACSKIYCVATVRLDVRYVTEGHDSSSKYAAHGVRSFYFTPMMDSTEKDILGLDFGDKWCFLSGNDVFPGSGGLELGSVWVVSVGRGWRHGGDQKAACGGGTRGSSVRGRPTRRRSRSSVACSSGCCSNSVGGSAVSSSRSAKARRFLILSLRNVGSSAPVGDGKRSSLCR